MKTKNLYSLFMGAAVILLGLVLLAVWTKNMGYKEVAVDSQNQIPTPDVACTADAMQCPNGSWIGRSGPDCQFVCPIIPTSTGTNGTTTSTTKNTATVEIRLNQRVTPLLSSITALTVVEDSRCPTDVQCIQAGTVRVSAQLEGGMGTTVQIFILNKPITTEAEEITLISVTPEKKSTTSIIPSDYRFTFEVKLK